MPGTTWNPTNTGMTLSNGNLTAYASGTGSNDVRSIYQIPFGQKVYFELRCDATATASYSGVTLYSQTAGLSQPNTMWVNYYAGEVYGNGGDTGFGIGSYYAGDVLCFAIDTTLANAYGWARLNNGYWNNTATPPPGQGAGVYIGYLPSGGVCAGFQTQSRGAQFTANFGGSPFTQQVPDGFLPGLGSDIVMGGAGAARRALILA